MRSTIHGNGLEGDHVRGVSCPKCRAERIAYNGNYFCVECPWVMPERPTPTNDAIVTKYLAQLAMYTDD